MPCGVPRSVNIFHHLLFCVFVHFQPLLHVAQLCVFSQIGLALINTGRFLFPYYYSSSFSISAPSLPIFLRIPNYKNYIIIFLHLSKYFPFSSHPAILNKCAAKSRLYLTLGVWDMLASLCQCNGLYIHTSKIVKLLSLQRSLAPLCAISA